MRHHLATARPITRGSGDNQSVVFTANLRMLRDRELHLARRDNLCLEQGASASGSRLVLLSARPEIDHPVQQDTRARLLRLPAALDEPDTENPR